MKKVISFCLSVLITSIACCQDKSESSLFLMNLINNDFREIELSNASRYDFSKIFFARDTYILGFIGDNYQRLKMKFLSIKKDPLNSLQYSLIGKSMVKNNICELEGNILITHVFGLNRIKRDELVKFYLDNGDTANASRFSKDEYVLTAKYQIHEGNGGKKSGIFNGILQTNFYVEDNTIKYNDLDLSYSDRFSNNLCVGTWKDYKSGVTKRCNFGEYRIPFSGDLDIGAGEFSPDEKYYQNGWQVYHDAYFLLNKQSKLLEEKQWWK